MSSWKMWAVSDGWSVPEQLQGGAADDSWKMELSSFLNELSCPHASLLAPDLPARFQTLEHRLILLDFLLTSLMTARMNKLPASGSSSVSDPQLVKSGTATHLSECVKALNLSSPPSGVTPVQFFRQLIGVVEKVNPKYREVLVGKPLLGMPTILRTSTLSRAWILCVFVKTQ